MNEQTARMTRHYAITGRADGDDEDTLILLEASDRDEAIEKYKAELRAIREVDPEDVDAPWNEIYINAVVWSATPIFEQE